MQRVLLALVLSAAPVLGQTVSYEAISLFPDENGWVRLPQVYYADRWLEDGCLVQEAEMVEGSKVGEGERDSYRRELEDMAGASNWFLQWRVITETPPYYIAVCPVALAAGGTSGVLYHFVIGDSQMRFLRDIDLPLVFADIEVGVPHTFRLELEPGSYAFYIDGELIDAGSPEGPYPTADSFVTFRGMACGDTTVVRWAYVRYGSIPADASGDFDSDGDSDDDDLYFFQDCLLGPDAGGPGCRWADMNGDGIANGADIGLFVDAMLAP